MDAHIVHITKSPRTTKHHILTLTSMQRHVRVSTHHKDASHDQLPKYPSCLSPRSPRDCANHLTVTTFRPRLLFTPRSIHTYTPSLHVHTDLIDRDRDLRARLSISRRDFNLPQSQTQPPPPTSSRPPSSHLRNQIIHTSLNSHLTPSLHVHTDLIDRDRDLRARFSISRRFFNLPQSQTHTPKFHLRDRQNLRNRRNIHSNLFHIKHRDLSYFLSLSC